MDKTYDVIAVGSGINSLVLGAELALKGRRVLVLEREAVPGGCMKTAELTLPGYHHDVFAMSVPGFVSAPHYSRLGPALEREGVRIRTAKRPTAVLTPDGQALVLERDRKANCATFESLAQGDGRAFERAMREIELNGHTISAFLGTPVLGRANASAVLKLLLKRGFTGVSGFASDALRPMRDWLETEFESELVRALIAPWILHCGIDPDAPMSAMMGKLIFNLIEGVGAPVIEGGIANLAVALCGIIERAEGRIICGCDVEQVLIEGRRAVGVATSSGTSYYARKGVVCNVTPQQLYERLLRKADLSPQLLQRARAFRYGRSGMQIHLALSQPAVWSDLQLNEVSLVHLTSGVDAVSKATNEAARGLLPSEPTIVVGQPAVVDPTRCPPGTGILWIQLLELPSKPKGDALGQIPVDPVRGWTEDLKAAYAERVIARLSKAIPDLKSRILEMAVLSPADFEKANVNLVGGDPYSGQCGIQQVHGLRPPRSGSHAAPFKNLFHIGASTHPGPSLAGISGYLVSQRL